MKRFLIIPILLIFAISISAEDGSRLWLRMEKGAQTTISSDVKSPTVNISVNELKTYWHGLPVILKKDMSLPQNDGFSIQTDIAHVTIKASRDIGLLYGAYALLRSQQTGEPTSNQRESPVSNQRESPVSNQNNASASCQWDSPAFSLRILDHWDNLDGSIERGYAGNSLWKWQQITKSGVAPQVADRITAYARANASIGINGAVLNNVNASPLILSRTYIVKVKHIADLLRPYGIKVYLSVNFASPMTLGGLKTADPLDKKVRSWWHGTIDDIYKVIPDFGGFLVKANSEGQPGPGDYHRTHADGANMMAEALKPHGGIVMWRCFVYGEHQGEDRVKQAVSEFKPLDGQFMDNVILQVKNGPLDFQPREPYNPVFDQIHHTSLMPEFQITQEYLGQSLHLVYLAPMWKEFFRYVSPRGMKAIAGVSNIGDDKNWCGHHFSQANWYAFGRLAWNPSLSSEEIAREWLAQTFTTDRVFVDQLTSVMLDSRETCVDYMMPLGLHHIFKADHHYGPEPDGNQPNFPMAWRPVYYHKAALDGIGYDRTSGGTDAVSQYRHPYDSLYNDIRTCPEEYLLWFHHVPWNYLMSDGNTLWNNLCMHYNRGVGNVASYIDVWRNMRTFVDEERFGEVDRRLLIQLDNAKEWRKVCLEYFQRYSMMPVSYYP